MSVWKARDFVEVRGVGDDGRLFCAGVRHDIEGWLFGIVGSLFACLPLFAAFGILSIWTGWSWKVSLLLYLLGSAAAWMAGKKLGYDPDRLVEDYVFWEDGRFTTRLQWFFIRSEATVLRYHDQVMSIEKDGEGSLFYLDDGQIVRAAKCLRPHRMTVQLNRALDLLRRESGREQLVFPYGQGSSPHVRTKKLATVS